MLHVFSTNLVKLTTRKQKTTIILGWREYSQYVLSTHVINIAIRNLLNKNQSVSAIEISCLFLFYKYFHYLLLTYLLYIF